MEDFHIEKVVEEIGIEIEDIIILYEEYFKEMEENILLMKELVKTKNYQALQHVVHNIKGMSINLSVKGVYDKAHELDLLLKKNLVKESSIYINEIINLYCIARKMIKKSCFENSLIK
ncbi:signal transduction histidine kinase [Clostridium aceticum]|uniref:Signal transduction histidine kinase n=1 Tax=Clostridium aceticum TaxID=84022 RepID=A0A0D8I9G7_9CLOT|nr:Hpt domain-containing protein [Clostridium aceticum]AKL96290.1 signal transduction histidine kinase [Clostridium aceticum]KJF26687.1 hypothetical protein TZ02_12575 [Clostridium aceticum]